MNGVADRLLPWILELDRDSVRRTDRRWRPTNLLWPSQARALLQDIIRRYVRLIEARPEMALLDRGFRYIACLSHMRVYLRQAKFHWKGDQLVFLRAVAGFYQEYGKVLRLIQEDMARGLLTPDSMTEGV